jgi:ribosome-binding factor A
MISNKMRRTNEEIRLALSSLIRNVKDPRVQQGLISITAVETTSDLHYCKVYISVLGLRSEKELKQGLKSASGWLRRELGRSLQLRSVPELTFELDKSIEHGAHINEILNELESREENGEDEH